MATNGSWIVKDILSAELDRRTNRDPPAWAPVGAYDSANAYLADLLETERIDSISFVGLAGAGVEPAHDCAELRLRGVAWNVLAGAAKADDSTPVIWTRNLRGLSPGDFAGADPERPRSWRDRLDPSDLRFGSEFIVLVRKSGSAEAIPVRNLTDAAFLGGSSNSPAWLQVLEAR